MGYSLLRKILYSLSLDVQLLTSHYPRVQLNTLHFLFHKYRTLIKFELLRYRFNPQSECVIIGNKQLYFGSPLGLTQYQVMLVSLDRNVFPLFDRDDKLTIIDVGAHMGFFAVPFAMRLPFSQIYAIEPVQMTSLLLKKNIAEFPSVKQFRLGLWNKDDRLQIYFNPQLLMYSSVFASRFDWDNNPHLEKIRVMTLDDFCIKHNIRRVELLKIDAEGAEEKILNGAKQTLARTKFILVECALDQLEGTTFSSFMSCLYSKKYNFQLIKIISTLEHQGTLKLANLLLKNVNFN